MDNINYEMTERLSMEYDEDCTPEECAEAMKIGLEELNEIFDRITNNLSEMLGFDITKYGQTFALNTKE